MTEKRMTPGSREAIASGCSCPVLDNHHGLGYRGGPGFVFDTACEVHGEPALNRKLEGDGSERMPR